MRKISLTLAVLLLILTFFACQSSKSAESEQASESSAQAQTSTQTGEQSADKSSSEKHKHANRHDHERHHEFDQPSKYAEEWNAKERDQWQKPGEVVELMGIESGDRVADLGTGTGYFLPHLSKAVGSDGEVLALDVSQEMLDYIKANITPELPHDNVTTRLVERDDPGLSAESVDSVLTVNTWHHIKNRVSYAKKVYRALRPGGTFVDVDYTKSTPEGPPKKIKLTPEKVADEFKKAGFDVNVADDPLPKQYVVIGTKPAK